VSFVSDTACVHRIPSRVRDDRDTPLKWDGMAVDIEVIWVRREPKYFCKEDWTAKSPNSPSGKSVDLPLLPEEAAPCRGYSSSHPLASFVARYILIEKLNALRPKLPKVLAWEPSLPSTAARK